MSLEKRKSALKSIGTPVTKTTTTSRISTFGFRNIKAPSTPVSPVIDTRRRSRSAQSPFLPPPPPRITYFQVDTDGSSYFEENYYETE